MKTLLIFFVLLMPSTLALADKPKPTQQQNEYVIFTREQIARVQSAINAAADKIRAQQAEIDRLKSSTGCT